LKELRLKAKVEFGNFVEKEGAAMSHFDAAGFSAIGASESTLFVAKQLAFEESARDCRAIDLDVGTGAPRRTPMNHAGNDVFTGTAFPLDQDRDIGGGDLVEALTDGLHAFGPAENDGLGGYFSDCLHERTN